MTRWMKKYTNKRQRSHKDHFPTPIRTNCTRALKSVFLREVTPVPCFFFLFVSRKSRKSRKPRNMGMPWAYVTKGPADTVRNSALIDEIFRKVRWCAMCRGSAPPGSGKTMGCWGQNAHEMLVRRSVLVWSLWSLWSLNPSSIPDWCAVPGWHEATGNCDACTWALWQATVQAMSSGGATWLHRLKTLIHHYLVTVHYVSFSIKVDAVVFLAIFHALQAKNACTTSPKHAQV